MTSLLSIFALLLLPLAAAREGPKTVKVIVGAEGEMRFSPAAITVRRGDVVRFVAFSGVHDVHFAKDANAGAGALPEPSPWLLKEGDSYELKVEFAPGTYHFQCDPHALMGMKGTLTVTE